MKLLTILLVSILLLAGCSGGKEDDLDIWMKEQKAKVKGKVEPLPELKKYEPFNYNADGSLADPFKGRMAPEVGGKKGGGLQPDLQRPKEALEAFPLESLRFVGYLEQGKKGLALFAAPDKSVYQIRVGNYMGQNFGVVTSISKDEVAIKEMVQDGTGSYVERRVTINPQEQE
jgi:type IV pilus assembly protein PilP